MADGVAVAQSEDKTSWRRFILACTVGNILEWYDFILYGYFSAIIAPLFFPASDRYVSMLITFSVFASGCLLRPLSGLLFGYLGDRFGRRLALILTIVFITIATTCMGLLPTYAQVGILAPILLTLCRLLQGVAVSGEEVGAAIFLTENAPRRCHGLVGGIILGSVYLGLMLGAVAAFIITSKLSATQLATWGWRVPFLLSSVFGVIALIARLRDCESPVFTQLHDQKRINKQPLRGVFHRHWQDVLKSTALSGILAVSIYLFVVYLPTYLIQQIGLTYPEALQISIISLFATFIFVPLVGMWADFVGPKFVFALGCIGFVILAYPIFFLLSLKTTGSIVLAEGSLIVCLSMVAATIFPLLINHFPADLRYSGVGLSFNLGMTIFGSTAPIVALSLVKYTGSVTSPFWYLLFAGLLSLSVLPFFARDPQADMLIVDESEVVA